MAKQIIKGDDLMVFDSTGKSIGYATSHTLTITGETVDTSSKDHGIYGAVEVQKITWEATSENLYTTEEYDALFSAMLQRQAVTIYFGQKTAAVDKTVAGDDFGAWSLAGTANVAKASTGQTTASYTATGSATGKEHAYFGKAYITSLTANANSGENATFSVTFTGAGSIAKKAA